MKLNHLNLTVQDVSEIKALMETYFGFRGMGQAPTNDAIAVLFGDDGFVLTLMKSPGAAPVHYPESFHIGFVQESEEQVNGINQRLKNDGFDVKPPRRFHGSWTFYFRAPGGFLIEVLC